MSALGDVTFRQHDGSEAVELFSAICRLYDAVFSQPPFRWTDEESEHHRQSLTDLMKNPTFGLVTAEAGGELIGFAYGVGLSGSTGWWSRMIEPLSKQLMLPGADFSDRYPHRVRSVRGGGFAQTRARC